jgi:hypothetical protein
MFHSAGGSYIFCSILVVSFFVVSCEVFYFKYTIIPTLGAF